MAAVKPQVDEVGPPQTVAHTHVSHEVELPYAKDAYSNKPAKAPDGTASVDNEIASGEYLPTNVVERPYAADEQEDGGSDRSATFVVEDAKNAGADVKDSLTQQATDNLQAADDKHHFA